MTHLANIILTIVFYFNQFYLEIKDQIYIERIILCLTLTRIYQVVKKNKPTELIIDALNCFFYLVIGTDYLLCFCLHNIVLNIYINYQVKGRLMSVLFITSNSYFFWMVSGHRTEVSSLQVQQAFVAVGTVSRYLNGLVLFLNTFWPFLYLNLYFLKYQDQISQ